MFASWGRILTSHRRLVTLLAAASLVLAVVAIVTVSSNLMSEGFVSEEAESARVDETLATEFGRGRDALVFLFDADRPVSDPAVRQAVEATLAGLATDPHFARVVTTWSSGDPRLVSTDGDATYAVAIFAPDHEFVDAELEEIETQVVETAEANGLTATMGGGRAVGLAATHEIEEGIVRAESVAVPLTILIQVVVFGSLVAAGVPLLIGALAIVASVALIFLLSTETFQSIFAVNIITMLGLGLGIDYSLFMVTRFREEIVKRPTAEALAVTMATVGKAILFSGITVIFGLAATLFFPLPALQSMGQAGMAVTAMAMIYGLTLLPALLAMLGPRINRLSIRRRGERAGTEGSLWRGIAQSVMRYPVPVLVGTLALLLVMALPLLRLDLTPGGPEVLPAGTEARVVSERLVAEFPDGDAEPIAVLVTVEDGEPGSAENTAALRTFSDEVATLPGVTRVDSFVAPELAEGAGFDWAAYTGDPATLPAPIQGAMGATVRDDRVLVQVSNSVSGSDLEQLVRDVREVQPAGLTVEAGGFAASSVDTLDGISDGLLPAGVFVLVGSYLILLLTFGSVFLPLKAIFMTTLSIAASLGAVVFVFQDGNFENLLRFEATGEIISTTPILMFCILFGLSMDYEVLMLSRIQEEYQRTGDNRASVAFGLEKTAKVITGAALIMVVVFGGFILADISIIKSMGFGLALAVILDATIVRGLLVPATMRLMGRWNWWAPTPVRRAVDRLGHASELPEAAASD